MADKIDDPRKKRLCNAKSRRGRPYKPHWAMKGGYVCDKHGGKAPQVKRKAQERLADLIDPERTLREMAAIAHFDPADLFDKNDHLLPLRQWPEHARRAISGFEVIRGNRDAGDGKFDEVVKPRIWDKTKALEMIAKHLNLFKEQLELTGGIEVKWKGDKDEK